MLDRGDLQRLLRNLGTADEEEPADLFGTAVDAAPESLALVPHDPNPHDLGPHLSHLEANFPTWAPSELPTHNHSRFGRTCDGLSAHGLTKTIAWSSRDGEPRQLEVCPCGARRQIHADGPEPWIDINAARKNPNWPTIRRGPEDPTTSHDEHGRRDHAR